MNTANPPIESFAQHGEDLIAWDYFGRKPEGFFIEVGANHPTELSQTWFFEQRGWRGLLVEPLPQRCASLREVRRHSVVCECAAGAPEQVGEAVLNVATADAWSRLGEIESAMPTAGQIRVPVRTLESLCAEHKVPAIDLLSIDVEGFEVEVLRGFDLARRRPAVVLLEDHLLQIDQYLYMRAAGYRLAKRTGCNNWWIPAGGKPLPQTLGEKLKLWNRLLFRNPWPKLRRLLSGSGRTTASAKEIKRNV